MQKLIEDGLLHCPACGSEWVHIDDAYVAGRPREDGEVVPVHVDSGGQVRHGTEVDLPGSDLGRRHVITIAGWCEGCGAHFGVEFKQHKGQTFVQVLLKTWRPIPS